MQIPPTTALLNLMASLPAQGASATVTAAPATATKSVPPSAGVPSGNDRPPSGILPRGSIVNILA